jgi:hypothetical protein
MSAPPAVRAEKVTINVKVRPRLAAWTHVQAAELGISEPEFIAALLEDAAQRGATAYGKRHTIVIRRRGSKPAANS